MEQCVMITGTMKMPLSSVHSSDSLLMVSYPSAVIIHNSIVLNLLSDENAVLCNDQIFLGKAMCTKYIRQNTWLLEFDTSFFEYTNACMQVP